jgi:hypothetical protein
VPQEEAMPRQKMPTIASRIALGKCDRFIRIAVRVSLWLQKNTTNSFILMTVVSSRNDLRHLTTYNLYP